jgi:hypothetical protein
LLPPALARPEESTLSTTLLRIALTPLALIARTVFKYWTVVAIIGETEMRWRASSHYVAGLGVKTIAAALTEGEPLTQSFPGLTKVG